MSWLDKIFKMVMSVKQYKLAEQANTMNYEAQKRANDTNIMLTRETNAHQMALAEKEYQRSLPTTQVANYMQAGMSRAGALSALSGAGTYNAPALNTAQVNPEMQDTSQMIGVIANALQMRQEEKIAREQMSNAKEIANIQAESAEKVAQINSETSAYSADKNFESTQLTNKTHLLSSLIGYKSNMDNVNLGYEELKEKQREFDKMSSYNQKLILQQIAESKERADLLSKQATAQKWENSMHAKEYRIILDNWDKIKENVGLEYDNEKAFLEMQKTYHNLMEEYYSSPKGEIDIYFREEIKLFSELLQSAGQFYLGSKIAGKKTPKVTSTRTYKHKGVTTTVNDYELY